MSTPKQYMKQLLEAVNSRLEEGEATFDELQEALCNDRALEAIADAIEYNRLMEPTEDWE